MDVADELLRANAAYARAFDKGDLPAPPARRVAVLTCMDARLDPARALGLAEGDAHVIRNAGGLATDDAIRSLAISQRLLGTEEVVVLMHTRCGMQGLDDEGFGAGVEAETGVRPPWSAGGFADLEAAVRASVERVRSSPFLPRAERVRGFVYEVESGRVREVPT